MSKGSAAKFRMYGYCIGIEESGDVHDGFVGGKSLDGRDDGMGETLNERVN